MKNQDLRPELLNWRREFECPGNHNADCCHTPDSAPRHRNMIWIVSDQQRACSLAVNGDPNVNTPNLDMLARFGINFPNAVSTYPICCPFRGTMMTGLPHNQCVPGHEYRMPPERKTIADYFNENGYDTAFFGKWHLDGCRQDPILHVVPPERRGRFKRWLGYENNDSQWNTWVHGHDKNQQEIPQYQLKDFEENALTDLFIDYIHEKAENPDEPFFAVLSVFSPHTPYVAPAEHLQHYKWHDMILRDNVPTDPDYQENAKRQNSRYCAMVENIDMNVGRIMQALRDCNLELDTNIMFFSDHGDMLGSQGLYGKVVPYEESVRIPFIIGGAVPVHFNYQTGTSRALITDLDIVPTTLGLCSIPVPEELEGYDYSYLRYCESEDPEPNPNEPQAVFAESPIPREGCRKAWRAVITRDGWKYATFETEEWLLYNLNKDPFEQQNLVHTLAAAPIRRKLAQMLREHIEKSGDSFEMPDSRFLD